MKCNKKDEVLVSFILHTFTNMSVICWDWQWSSYPCDFEMLRCGTITCSIPIHSCTTFDEGLLCYHYKYLWSFFYWICPKSEQKTKNMAAKLLLFSSSISFEDTVSRPLDIYIYIDLCFLHQSGHTVAIQPPASGIVPRLCVMRQLSPKNILMIC